MVVTSAQLIVLALLLPIVASALIVLSDKKPNLREAVTLITATLVAIIVITLARRVLAGEIPRGQIISAKIDP